uniref:Uncharacterized protein n=1 Tax=Spirodela intermedia TaxID=51605 RepID=A0A8S0WSW8_SPIIN
MHSSNQIGIHFLKDSGFRALARGTVATEPAKVYRKDISYPGSVSPFFRDELLVPVLYFSLWTEEKGAPQRVVSKKGVEIHRTLEWKLKRDVATVPSEMVRSLAQEERVDPYHLDLVLLPLLFLTIPSRSVTLTWWKSSVRA